LPDENLQQFYLLSELAMGNEEVDKYPGYSEGILCGLHFIF